MYLSAGRSYRRGWQYILSIVSLFALVNLGYCHALSLVFDWWTIPYVLVLEFAAIGLSYHLTELLLPLVFPAVLPPKIDDLGYSPPVALLCVTCDDVDPALLEVLKVQTYRNLSLFVLDDSQLPAHQGAVDSSGLKVLRRNGRRGYKAGNLNNWLVQHGAEFRYFVVADADSLLPPEFVETMVRHMEHPANRNIAILESLIRTWNTTNVFASLIDATFVIRERFRLHVSNRFGLTLSVGHNNIYRTPAILSCGGFCEKFLAEDFATCITALSNGHWACMTAPVVSYERQPENITEFARRQSRWTIQTFQLMKLDVPGTTWCITFEIVRALHFFASPGAMLFGLMLLIILNVTLSPIGLHTSSANWSVAAIDRTWTFWVVWLFAPAALSLAFAARYGVSPSVYIRSTVLRAALLSVTAWQSLRHLVRHAVGRQIGFTVTGRSPTPSLGQTFLLAGPVQAVVWMAAITTMVFGVNWLNLLWLVPACLAPFVVHHWQRTR
jgi:hypothetical protein